MLLLFLRADAPFRKLVAPVSTLVFPFIPSHSFDVVYTRLESRFGPGVAARILPYAGSELNLSLRINAEALSVVLADDVRTLRAGAIQLPPPPLPGRVRACARPQPTRTLLFRTLAMVRMLYLPLVLFSTLLQSVVLSWPYHCILCWGYTANTFQFKVLSRPTVSTNAAGEQSRNLNERIMDPFVLLVDESIVHDRRMQPLTEAGLPSPTSTSSSPDMMAAAAVAAAAAAGSAAAGDGLVVSDTDGMPPEPSPFGMAPPFAASSSGARTEEDATDFHTFDSKDTPSSSDATAGVEVLNAHATPASRMASSGGAGGASSLEPAVQEGDDAGGASSSDDAIGSITSYVLL
ncbi:hypothetical protein EON66_10165, partial [archaeon]